MSFLGHEGFVGHSAVGSFHNCFNLHSFGQLHFRFRRICIVLLWIIVLHYDIFTDSYGRDALKVARLHQHFQTPTCFFPFLLGSPQSWLHSLFQTVLYNLGLSCCLYSTHEWLGSRYANCYLTELTIMVCGGFFSCNLFVYSHFLFDHAFCLLLLLSGFCCLLQALQCLCTALCTVRPNPQLGTIPNSTNTLYFNIFWFILSSFKRCFAAISQFLFDILVLQWFGGYFKQFIWGKHNSMFYK